MKITAIRRALLLGNVFNLLVSLYFIIIAIIALVQLRWYHQLTVTVKVRYLLTSVTSYFAFLILILAGLLLLTIFVTGTFGLSPRTYANWNTAAPHFHHDEDDHHDDELEPASTAKQQRQKHHRIIRPHHQDHKNQHPHHQTFQQQRRRRIVLRDSASSPTSNKFTALHDTSTTAGTTNTGVCCSILIHLLAATCLVIILIIWLFNTGELVRDSISTQLDAAFSRYQFTNRTNYYTIAIDGMQDINNCCGSLDYTDFPHQRSGLTVGHYPGSCCGKNIFGVNARVLCTPEEIWRAKQTYGCTTVLANYYDLISILIVPVALVSLFVNITIIALITILKGNSQLLVHELDGILPSSNNDHNNTVAIVEQQQPQHPNPRQTHQQTIRLVGGDGEGFVTTVTGATREDSQQQHHQQATSSTNDKFEMKQVGQL